MGSVIFFINYGLGAWKWGNFSALTFLLELFATNYNESWRWVSSLGQWRGTGLSAITAALGPTGEVSYIRVFK